MINHEIELISIVDEFKTLVIGMNVRWGKEMPFFWLEWDLEAREITNFNRFNHLPKRILDYIRQNKHHIVTQALTILKNITEEGVKNDN